MTVVMLLKRHVSERNIQMSFNMHCLNGSVSGIPQGIWHFSHLADALIHSELLYWVHTFLYWFPVGIEPTTQAWHCKHRALLTEPHGTSLKKGSSILSISPLPIYLKSWTSSFIFYGFKWTGSFHYRIQFSANLRLESISRKWLHSNQCNGVLLFVFLKHRPNKCNIKKSFK